MIENKEPETLFERLLASQSEIGKISKDKENPFFKSKYADINVVIDMIKPILNKHGILFMQPLTNVGGKPAITTILVHGEERIEYTTVFPDLPKPADGKESNPFQEMGSAITYYRRYALISILGLEATDDDANSAPTATQNSKPVHAQQQPKQPPTQKGNPTEIPTCNICQNPMKPQKNDKTKFFCKHEDGGNVTWGKPVYQKELPK